ncbi:hypothetical protein ABSL23_16455 (plasmid) [Halobacterium sp. NMX12-1]|jgi:hypothetical protein|uniref:DUF8120 domain-containing protein n=1 Tax=Halobacterium sp. NMX12-1 TaxID=3166650 RepID=A0AAU8CJ16_9EURY
MSSRELPATQYRRLDRVSKLVGLALVAGGLAVGGDTAVGLALAMIGAVIGVLTVFIEQS